MAVDWKGEGTLLPTDLGDYTSYDCACHLFSLARGMIAMVTAHSGAPPPTLLSSAFPSVVVMKGGFYPRDPQPLMR